MCIQSPLLSSIGETVSQNTRIASWCWVSPLCDPNPFGSRGGERVQLSHYLVNSAYAALCRYLTAQSRTRTRTRTRDRIRGRDRDRDRDRDRGRDRTRARNRNRNCSCSRLSSTRGRRIVILNRGERRDREVHRRGHRIRYLAVPASSMSDFVVAFSVVGFHNEVGCPRGSAPPAFICDVSALPAHPAVQTAMECDGLVTA